MTPKEKKALAALLPKQSTQAKINPARLCYLMIADPKWGKTEFFMSNKNAVLLATEEGHKFQRGHKMIIDCCDAPKRSGYENRIDSEGCPHMTFVQAVKTLELFPKKFDMVIIDTADMAVKMCVDYHVEQAGVNHISDMGDYGKGYEIGLNVPFRQQVMKILKTGRGVVFIAHSKIETARFTSGERARKEARLAKGAKDLLESQADIILHGELGKRRNGNRLRDRILVCEGDSDTMAGNRTGAMLPARYVVKRPGQWDQFMSFFSNPEASEKQERLFKKLYRRSGDE